MPNFCSGTWLGSLNDGTFPPSCSWELYLEKRLYAAACVCESARLYICVCLCVFVCAHVPTSFGAGGSYMVAVCKQITL